MTKSILAGVIALAIVLSCGIIEVVLLTNDYHEMHEKCLVVLQKAEAQTLTVDEYENFAKDWVKLRETSELLLPHNDVYELNLRFAEARSYAQQGDYKQLHAQLAVVEELLSYIPHLMMPNLRHIV